MQASAWIGLFQRIPTEQHDSLMLMTSTGAEIVLQRIVRLDADLLIAVGRLSGSTDEAKLLIVPYDQLTYLSFNKKLSDEQIEKSIGKPASAVLPEKPGQSSVASPAPQSVAANKSAAESPAQSLTTKPAAETPRPGQECEQAAAKPPQRPSPPSKSVLLARLRQRLADDISKRPHI